MKYLILACCFLIISCDKTEVSNLNGEWKLIETLMDPGDLSGVFEPSNADVTVIIKNNSTVTANGFICGLSPHDWMTGSLSIADSVISSNCPNQASPLKSHLHLSGSNLLISGDGCIEPCIAKFVKIK